MPAIELPFGFANLGAAILAAALALRAFEGCEIKAFATRRPHR